MVWTIGLSARAVPGTATLSRTSVNSASRARMRWRGRGFTGDSSWCVDREPADRDGPAQCPGGVVEDAEAVAHEELPVVVQGERRAERRERGSVRAVGEGRGTAG